MLNSKTIAKEEDEVSYPCLMKSSVSVALFTSRDNGIVMHRIKDSALGIGMRFGCSYGEHFELFTGSIQLSNQKI